MKKTPAAPDTKMIDYPELERIDKEFRELRHQRSWNFLKYFLRNIVICGILMAIFFAILYAVAKA